MKTLPFLILFFISCVKEKEELPFMKGVYGNPGTLLEAGYSFDSLGMNAVFVRSGSLTQGFYGRARLQGCRVFVEFPTLNGKDYLTDHPEAWPINEKGEKAPPADWFMGICPTDPGFKTYRSDQLKDILKEFEVDGVFLDYLHWHAQFETPNPILPETCFCGRCTKLFASHIDTEIKGGTDAEKAGWILDHYDKPWRDWRNGILNKWVEEMGEVVQEYRPKAVLGVFFCAWYPEEHQTALYRTLGIDVAALAERVDVLSPMLFHQMTNRPTQWVGQYVSWLEKIIGAENKKFPQIWPIVQAHNKPGIVSAEEFRQVMVEGSRPPASGIMMFSDQSLIDDPEKVAVMKELYKEVK